MVSYEKLRPQKFVAIRQIEGCNWSSFSNLKAILHEHVLAFSAAYFYQESVYLVSDIMSVSLVDIVDTPLGQLLPGHTAQICQCILRGLQYVHETLNTAHGEVRASNILLNRTGNVKLGR